MINQGGERQAVSDYMDFVSVIYSETGTPYLVSSR